MSGGNNNYYAPYNNNAGDDPNWGYGQQSSSQSGYGQSAPPPAGWGQGQPNSSVYPAGAYPNANPGGYDPYGRYTHSNSPPPTGRNIPHQSPYSSLAGAMGPVPVNPPSRPYYSAPPPEIALAPADPNDYPLNASTSSAKVCARCGTNKTPLWRRHPQTDKPVCNACGLYFLSKQRDRPAERWESPPPPSSGGSTGPTCANCGTTVASAWRRDKKGDQVCNACGVYERNRGTPRPVDYRKDVIQTRSRE
ncbi:hypothetical protein C8F01DRAFT_1084767 [Mycena amicta]|nr:hypothetical protein C8F01DRAFT_1084767 [Mycena amicta]